MGGKEHADEFLQICVFLQNDSWADLQCFEAFHGDESEIVWWLHATVQDRTAKVCTEREAWNIL